MASQPHSLYNGIDERSEAEKQVDFMSHFIVEKSIVGAAALAKVSVLRVKAWRQRDREFEAAFNEAAEIIILEAEEELYKRAVQGEMQPVYQGGKKVGDVRKKSDILLMFFLKANMPEKYNRPDESKDKGNGKEKDGMIVILPPNGREVLNQCAILPAKADIPIQDKLEKNEGQEG